MSKPVLTYFAGRGLGEVIRLVFAESNVDFVDNRVTDISSLKESGTLPFGQVPLLEIDGISIAQSFSILRYLSKKYGLRGSNDQEEVMIDMVAEGTRDLSRARPYGTNISDSEKEKFVSEVLPKWLSYFEKLLQQNVNGNGFIVGNRLSYADIALFNTIDTIQLGFPNSVNTVRTFKHVSAHFDLIAARPNIAAWLKNRPQTAW